jgi:competence protein ComEC
MARGSESFHNVPALVLSSLIAIGICAGRQLHWMDPVPLFCVASGAAVLLVVMLFLDRSPAIPLVRAILGALLCLTLGALKYSVDDIPGSLEPLAEARTKVALIGEVVDAPSALGNRQRFSLQARAIVRGDSSTPCNETGLVTFIPVRKDTTGVTFSYGSLVALEGTVETPPDAGNPGEFSPKQYYNANGITFLMQVRGADCVRILDSTRGSVAMRSVVLPLRKYILSEIDEDIGGEEGEFLKGLLIGERTGLSPVVRRAFLDSGVAHILAVSGSNVAVVAMAILMVLSLLRVPRQASKFLTMVGLVVYMLVTGAQPPVVRATIMAIAFLISGVLSRRVHPLNGVGLSALIMFAIDARQMFDVGFQLSFGAVLAILILYPPLFALFPAGGGCSWVRNAGRQIYSVVAVSLAASVGTLPLTAIVFGRLSLVGFLANLVIVPASGVSVVLGMISPLAEPLSHWVASAYAEVNRLVLAFTIVGAEYAASMPWATTDTAWFHPVHALPYYAAMACLLALRDPARVRRLGILLLFCANVALFWPSDAFAQHGESELRVTIIDVGQGDAALIQAPDGHTTMIDAGPPPRDGSPWGTAVAPLLRRLGISSLDEVIITHMHDDHAGGLVPLLRSCRVKTLIVDPVAIRSLKPVSDADHPQLFAASRGMILGDSTCRLYVLSPDRMPSDSAGNANRLSVVIKLQFRHFSMVFTGDAEGGEESRMVEEYGDFLKSDALKVGHHGSRAGTTDEFIATVRPVVATISVGRYNRFGHPARATLQRLTAAGVEVLRTDEMGALVLSSDGTTFHRMHWR